MGLAVPLTKDQIVAANRLHERLAQWRAADEALLAVRERFPEFDMTGCLVKTLIVNALYGTNVFAITRMAEHVRKVLDETDLLAVGPELVEQIAALPKVAGQKRDRRHHSFASKFAHFFVDAEGFPIYDSYAVGTIEHHLRPADRVHNPDRPYEAFVANFQTVRKAIGWEGSNRELDRYLWIAGLYRAWKSNPEARINAEVSSLFRKPPADVQENLARVIPFEVAP